MTDSERKARYRAGLAKKRAAAAPVEDGISATGASEMAALLGLKTMSAARLAALRAQPGAADCDDDDQPLDEFGEPLL